MNHVGDDVYRYIWAATPEGMRVLQPCEAWGISDKVLGRAHHGTWTVIWLPPGNLRGIPHINEGSVWSNDGIELGFLIER